MTLTIELPSDLEQRLNRTASRYGQAPAEYVLGLVEAAVRANEGVAPATAIGAEERRARVYAIAGKYADVGGTVEEFLQEKRAAAAHEEARYRRWSETQP